MLGSVAERRLDRSRCSAVNDGRPLSSVSTLVSSGSASESFIAPGVCGGVASGVAGRDLSTGLFLAVGTCAELAATG